MSFGLKLLAALVVLGALAWGAWQLVNAHDAETAEHEQDQRNKSEQQARAERAYDAETAIAVTADALQRAYGDNPVAADLKFGNKKLAVDGTIAKIAESDDKASQLIYFRTDGIGVLAIFNNDEIEREAIAKLKRGQRVIVSGFNAGRVVGSDRAIAIGRSHVESYWE